MLRSRSGIVDRAVRVNSTDFVLDPSCRRDDNWSALLLLLAAGTAGYMVFEHWGLLDALYMTVITVATVGFREVRPLTPLGRIFTMVLILMSVGTLGFALGVFVDFLSEGRVKRMLEERRMTRIIDGLSGHHVVTGLGRVGWVVAESLAAEHATFVAVERDAGIAEAARERGWLVVEGDATEEAVLVSAGVARARDLVTTLDTDGANMFVTVIAKTVNPSVLVVARSEHEASESALLKAGANRVATPNVIGARRLANFVLRPLAADYFDLVTHADGVAFRLQDVELTSTSPLVGKTIRQAMVRDKYGTYILAIRHPDGTVDTNPSMDTVMDAGALLVVIGTPEQTEALARQV